MLSPVQTFSPSPSKCLTLLIVLFHMFLCQSQTPLTTMTRLSSMQISYLSPRFERGRLPMLNLGTERKALDSFVGLSSIYQRAGRSVRDVFCCILQDYPGPALSCQWPVRRGGLRLCASSPSALYHGHVVHSTAREYIEHCTPHVYRLGFDSYHDHGDCCLSLL
ncbi:hypothetical protein BKA70DRAFT_1297558 [Coprinopsis sp. MPI-PUGE-AT-0042]|nr:hypothetical protein BKA70DRAFT_1297558 [Coprinopsis sp. MPI-PUGE-AT-0042]